MKISIAMATYNGERYILDQLNSFKDQTLLPDEVIITDDKSTDNTLCLIKEFSKSAPFRVKVHENTDNLGYTQNFNKALSLCKGSLVFLSDQDDVWFDTKIEYMVNLAGKNPLKSVFMCDAEFTDDELQPSGVTKQEQLSNLGIGVNRFVMGCCILVRKDFLNDILPIPKQFKGHDNWIANIADRFNKRLVDKKVLQYYRRHHTNESLSLANKIEKVTVRDKQKLFFTRLKRKFRLDTWIEYFNKKRLLKSKVKEIREKKNF